MAVALLAEHDLSQLSETTARAVAALGAVGLPVDILVIGANVGVAGGQAAAIEGVRKVRVLDDVALEARGAEALAEILLSLKDEYSHFAAIAGAIGKDVLPRFAAKLDVSPVTDVIAVHGPNRFDRPIYAGNAIETVTCNETKIVLTIRPSAFSPARSDGSAPIEPLATPAASIADAAEFLVAHRTSSDTPDLSTARIVVAGGIALGSVHHFEMIENLASVLGAAVGATRAAVDASYAPNDWQIGQTGKAIAPDLYIAIGISGALQHLAGIQGARKIVAINTDPDAPLMQIADYRLVGDLFEVVPQLTAELEKRLNR
ncbi:electron transfer flavoprotein subunit alpha/FixB family protein [Pelagibacterium xiamenense]|uniref:electron transfer flavoprotein subunit alpha/FixB family protein n=1 Tax=Pelagibacterium xiamenense TaxID=2901140 RepID=UPI001E5BF1F1|nr:FAD-binding protein [Pelagibacterium xiamenense]MCD7059180.1 FAD-binding protein [Pelagibacterium xiamenense]